VRDRIRHVPTGTVLDLCAPDYGHPDGRAIISDLYGRMTRGTPMLLCKHGSPIYLQMRPTHQGSADRQMWGIHFDGSQCERPASPGISDEHKRQTEYVIRAAEHAGYTATAEVMLESRVKPDAVIYGNESVAIEVQRSYIKRAAAVGRTKKAIQGGMAASVWFSDREPTSPPDWFFRVPSVGMNQLPWGVLPPMGSARVTSGMATIEAAKCSYTYFPKCPQSGGRPCGQFHPHRGVRSEDQGGTGLAVDDLAAQVPAGEIIPMRFRGKEVLLVSRASLTLYEELTGRPAELVFHPAAEERLRSPGIAGRIECDHPQVVQIERPHITIVKGRCIYGCEEPASPYACGWRCDIHRPDRSKPKSWAALNLSHLPGRCVDCGWHIKTQDHAGDCPTRGET
jgi:hypothetical protein